MVACWITEPSAPNQSALTSHPSPGSLVATLLLPGPGQLRGWVLPGRLCLASAACSASPSQAPKGRYDTR